jgi:tetratricopeptide (TPR) repeat protein
MCLLQSKNWAEAEIQLNELAELDPNAMLQEREIEVFQAIAQLQRGRNYSPTLESLLSIDQEKFYKNKTFCTLGGYSLLCKAENEKAGRVLTGSLAFNFHEPAEKAIEIFSTMLTQNPTLDIMIIYLVDALWLLGRDLEIKNLLDPLIPAILTHDVSSCTYEDAAKLSKYIEFRRALGLPYIEALNKAIAIIHNLDQVPITNYDLSTDLVNERCVAIHRAYCLRVVGRLNEAKEALDNILNDSSDIYQCIFAKRELEITMKALGR